MKKLVGFVLVLTVSGCAKLMEDQPGTADSTQQVKDTAVLETASTKASRVPERFLTFYNEEFRGMVGATGSGTHTIDVKSIMDVLIEFSSDASGMSFIIKKDGLDITEMPSQKWEGRLVPGRYLVAVIPGPNTPESSPYSLVVKEN